MRGRGLQRAVVLTRSSHSNKLYIVMALKQQTSYSVTIKNRNKKNIYTGYGISTLCGSAYFHVCWLTDARARCSAATQHTGREVFICGLRWCLFVSVVHQAARRLVRIVLDESPLPLCVGAESGSTEAVFFRPSARGSPRAARHDFEVTENIVSGCFLLYYTAPLLTRVFLTPTITTQGRLDMIIVTLCVLMFSFWEHNSENVI